MAIKQLVDSIATDVVERAQLNLGVVRTINGKKRRRVASESLQKGLGYKNLTRYNNPIIQFGVDSPELKNYADVIEFGRRKGVEGNEEQTKTNHEAETKWFNFCKSCHVAMAEEMKDPKNLGEFLLLLNQDANTAFQQFNVVRGRAFE